MKKQVLRRTAISLAVSTVFLLSACASGGGGGGIQGGQGYNGGPASPGGSGIILIKYWA